MTPTSFAVALDHVYLVANASSPAELHPLDSDPTDFVVEQGYSVVASDFSRMQDFVLGEVHTRRVLLGEALNQGFSALDVADSHSRSLAQLVALMYRPECLEPTLTPEFEQAVRNEGALAYDLLHVRNDELLDFPWGPHVLRTLMQHSSGCQFFVVEVAGMQTAVNGADYQTAICRAAVLLEMGFEPYPNSPYFFFDLQYALPELPPHLALNSAAEELEDALG